MQRSPILASTRSFLGLTLGDVRFSHVLLLLLTVVTAVLAMRNAALIFDDLALPTGFAKLIATRGQFLAAVGVFIGEGLSSEYRTYGISRALHFVLWDIGGNDPRLYALWITTTQGLSALALHSILRRCLVRSDFALILPILWMCSPFAITNCFHHYTYLILPWQILIAVALYGEFLKAPTREKLVLRDWLLATGSGIALALSGEAHLVAAFGFLVFVAVDERRTIRGRWMALVFAVAISSLITHYAFWRAFVFDQQLPQRFNLALDDRAAMDLAAERAPLIFESFIVGLVQPIVYIWDHSHRVVIASAAISVFVTAVVLVSQRNSGGTVEKAETERANASAVGENKLGVWLIFFFLGSICLYLVVMLKVGNIAEIFPRGYGYAPYTILAAAVLVLMALVLERNFRTFFIAVFLTSYLALYFQMELEILPDARSEDDYVTRQIVDIHRRCPDCAILFKNRYLASNRTHIMDNSTPGLRGGGPALDLIESPYVAYWVQSLYVKNVIGIPTLGWEVDSMPGNSMKLFVNPPKETMLVPRDAVAVITNLSIAGQPPSIKNVRVYDRWNDFAKLVSDVSIQRGKELVLQLAPAIDRANLFTIDMGHSPGNPMLGIFEDKTFEARPIAEPPNDSFIDSYGLASGSDSVYSLVDGKVPEYFASNRNGEFVYRIDFRADRLEAAVVNLDFWELWQRKAGERRFAVDFKLNDGEWDESTEMDVAAMGGNDPVSLRFEVQNPHTVLIRFRKLPDARDVPFIQGIRMQRIR